MTKDALTEIRGKLDKRLSDREVDRDRLEKFKKETDRVIRRAEGAKRILERA